MSSAYQPFPITEFKTGLHNYLQPWIRPADAFEPLVNAYIYRGVVNKRAGSSIYGNQLGDHNPVMGIMRYTDESTGAIFLLVASTRNLYLYNSGTDQFDLLAGGPWFTGNISNFFLSTNWQPSAGAASTIYMVNNKDPITLYDGTIVSQPPLYTNSAHTESISTAIDVKVYKNRLLAIRPTLSSSSIPQNQGIYWSALNNPTDFVADTAGHGGFLEAPTGDIIQSAEFLRDVVVVFFSNSTWIFRYTGNDFNPFRWDKVNDSKSSNAPYASIQYDERVTSVGSTGFIACDGVNVQRYDTPIIDYYEDEFSQLYYTQAYSQRYDNLNQSWTMYVSNGRDPTVFPIVGGVAPGSDSALIYNFAESTWATYTFPVPMTCMGMFYRQSGDTWADLPQPWDDTDSAWNSYYEQSRAPILLGGSTDGFVYHLDDGHAVTDNGFSIVPDIISTRWNPSVIQGQKIQFGYIDIYYYIASVDPENPIGVTLNFYVDNSSSIAASRPLTLDGPPQSEYTFKRIYMNLVGQFIKMEIDPSVDSFMQFIGFILWVRPAGRLTR